MPLQAQMLLLNFGALLKPLWNKRCFLKSQTPAPAGSLPRSSKGLVRRCLPSKARLAASQDEVRVAAASVQRDPSLRGRSRGAGRKQGLGEEPMACRGNPRWKPDKLVILAFFRSTAKLEERGRRGVSEEEQK